MGAAGRPVAEPAGVRSLTLDSGWQVACAPAGAECDPPALDALDWVPATVPGTAAGAVGPGRDFDSEQWIFRVAFDTEPVGEGERALLCLDGIATVADVTLNGRIVLRSESMFARHEVDVTGLLSEHNELAIRCHALAPLLAQRRKPRARWRTKLVPGGLRFHRTMLIGRAPGFAPGPAAVGPWRPVRLERRHGAGVQEVRVRTRVDGSDGVVAVRARAVGGLDACEARLEGPSGSHRVTLGRDGEELTGELRVPGVALWWPHTHGTPVLHELALCDAQERVLDARRVGFRSLAAGAAPAHDVEQDGIDLHVNGVRVFARGAVWTPADPVGLAPSGEELRTALQGAVDAGMNMLRVPGIAAYESDAFHDLCDELGLLLWQDFMFANLDYPVADDGFRAAVEDEAAQELERLAPRPSLAVLCGSSEVEQQAAMVGLEPGAGRGPLFGEVLPRLVAESGADAVWVPSAPCGGDLPFRTDRGVANYYGVGAYLRPLEDARRAGVRFAAECLAFSNVPDPAPDAVVHDPRWKAGVPRDVGAGWDFEDVRDHYLRLLYGVDPVALRSTDHARYLDLSRAVTGEVMAEVFGEWRRAGSPCGGGLVLWLRDLVHGAGWGVVDRDGAPKAAWHHLRRALAPQAVWTTDEGLNGIAAHVANDRAEPLEATLRVALYRDGSRRVDQASEDLVLAPHETVTRGVEELVGHFADVSWAYRFGPPAQDVVVATLEGPDEQRPLSQSFRFPAGRPVAPRPAGALGLTAVVGEPEAPVLTLECTALAYGVRVAAPGFVPADDAFCLEPGRPRSIPLVPTTPHAAFTGATVTAINSEGTVRVPPPS